jgi:hypothetical protein
MYSRFYNASVCIMWLVAMTWLFTQKILPSLLVGQSPSYKTILENSEPDKPIGWTLWLNNKQMGWALCSIESLEQGPKEIHSWIHFDEIPLADFSSGWTKAISRIADQPLEKKPMDVKSTLTIDTFGNLLRLDSRFYLNPQKSILRLQGIVEGMMLKLDIRYGEFSYYPEIPLPKRALLNNSFSPQIRLPNLAVGQSWAMPSLNPLHPMNNLMEMMQAVVESKEPIYWDKEIFSAWVVVYKSDPGSSIGSNSIVRGKAWVLENGTVIKQQTMIFDSILCFIRMSEGETAQLLEKFKQNGNSYGSE